MRVKLLFCTYMTCALKYNYAYEYELARKATYYVRMSTALRVKQLMHISIAFRVRQLIVYV